MEYLSAKASKKRSAKLPLSSIFMEDDSLHFEYGHCLPKSKTCSVVHGHSSIISVLKNFDHKFIICSKYAKVKDGRCHISFDGPNGHIELDLPEQQVILLDVEATSENIASEVARQILNKMPNKVKAVKAFFFEGANKGASLFRMRND